MMPEEAGGWISAYWPVPQNIRALTTTRGLFQQDQRVGPPKWRPEALANHPKRLRAATVGEVGQLQWLTQVHRNRCVRADFHSCASAPEADAVWTSEANLGLVIQTADCVPVVVARRDGARIGAAHGGWRGLVGGVIEQLIAAMEDEASKPRRQPVRTVGSILGRDRVERIVANQDPWRNPRPEPEISAAPASGLDLPNAGHDDRAARQIPATDRSAPRMDTGAGVPLIAWIGPAIGPDAYEVGEDVHAAVLAITGRLVASNMLEPSTQPSKWFLNLFHLTEWLLRRAGVETISCQHICTYSNPNLHSYRRDGVAAGRLATVVWKTH